MIFCNYVVSCVCVQFRYVQSYLAVVIELFDFFIRMEFVWYMFCSMSSVISRKSVSSVGVVGKYRYQEIRKFIIALNNVIYETKIYKTKRN